jgi:splicing factor 3A subunit 3
VENLERAYKRTAPAEGESSAEIDNLFTGEEAWGKFLDLTVQHEGYLNLPGIKRINYLQYLDNFDKLASPFAPPKLDDKRKNDYFVYVGTLSSYLESFLRRTRPLEDLGKVFAGINADFEKAWEEDDAPGWGSKTEKPATGPAAPVTEGTGEGVWCAACAREFKNDNVYKAHLSGKKHIKNAQGQQNGSTAPPEQATPNIGMRQLKDRAIAEREYRVKRLAAALSSVRADTRANVERKQGMTERERQQELEALFAEAEGDPSYLNGADEESDAGSDTSEQIDNPLRLPLGWDGKPIPYWLYKLHGLGNEYKCQICGGYTYMGRRAYEKHFTEARHVQGLKMLGINNPSAFREITSIQDALNFWHKLQADKGTEDGKKKDIVQMEDAEGNVMPEKVYYDLQKQGLL